MYELYRFNELTSTEIEQSMQKRPGHVFKYSRASLSLVKPHVLAGMGPNYTQYINIVNMKRCVMMLTSCQDEESLDQLFQNHQGGLAALDLLDL